jgi:hypothetical protein
MIGITNLLLYKASWDRMEVEEYLMEQMLKAYKEKHELKMFVLELAKIL